MFRGETALRRRERTAAPTASKRRHFQQPSRERVKEKGYSIRISKAVKEFLVEEGYDDKMGARPLRRAVERYLEDTLAESILQEEITSEGNNLLVAKIKDKKETKVETK